MAAHQIDALARDLGRRSAGRDGPPSLIGRDAELGVLADLAQRPEVRWVTLTGRSGIGKSLLLRGLVERLRTATDRATGPLPTVWVDGADPRAADLVRDRVRLLKGGRAVVIVDDVDLLEDQATRLRSLLTRRPQLTVVASAVVPLGLDDEVPLPLAGLHVGAPAPPSATGAPAVALFVDRARRHDPGFAADDQDLVDVQTVVAHLRGVPLDIEIAAANVRVLGIGGLVRELTTAGHDRAHLRLRNGPDAPRRGEALGAAVRRTYDRLTWRARRLVRALSVFEAPFTLDQARAVDVARGDADLVTALGELVDAGLVEPAGPKVGGRGAAVGDTSWSLSPLARELALALSVGAGESDALRDRHASHHASLARDYARAIDDARDADGMPQLIRLLPDLLGAVDWWTARGEQARALRLAADLAPAALRLGQRGAVLSRLRILLADPAAAQADPLTRGEALLWLAQASMDSTDSVDALPGVIAHWRDGLALVRTTGSPLALLRALGVGVRMLPLTRDIALTRSLLAEGRALAEEVGHLAWTARYEAWEGMLAHQSRDLTKAWTLGVSALARARRSGDVHCQVACGLLLIPLAAGRPPVPGGIPSAAELLALSQAIGDASFASVAMALLAEHAIEAGDTEAARRWISMRLREVSESATWTAAGYSMMLMARIHVLDGQLHQAARLHGSVLPVLPTLLAGAPPSYADRYVTSIDSLRDRLGEVEFERLAHEGSLRSWADALGATAEAATPGGSVGPPHPRRDRLYSPGVLSAREQQVLRHIVDGLTNREIAQLLGVTAKSVMHHSTAIYRKLGVRGRAEAVAWAVRNAAF